MKPKILLAFGLILGLLTPSAMAETRTVILDVENMNCALCPFTVKYSLANTKGVLKVSVSYENQTAMVVFDDEKTSLEALTEATAEYGYPSHLATEIKE